MDGVALASVIGSSVVGLAGVGIAFWKDVKLAREKRLAESYLEVLRIVEREAQWIEANVTYWKLAAEEAEIEPDPEVRKYLPQSKRVTVPEPAATDQATIAAHLEVFGSDKVRKLYDDWRSTATRVNAEDERLWWNAGQGDYYPDVPSLRDLKPLLEVLQPAQRAARLALADAIAKELGHR